MIRTRIGQASECFVYWKDPMTNDTWGLNFTSPIDAKQFRECCSWWSGYLPELNKGEALINRRKSQPPPLLQVLPETWKSEKEIDKEK
ncbi:hypothetical protein J6590_000150 [Homalodisca vitripennis]|nr:hypothetical protein J6590_000150 [Homalodisca vitripennis]